MCTFKDYFNTFLSFFNRNLPILYLLTAYHVIQLEQKLTEVIQMSTKNLVSTKNAPAAIGPYSQGITASGTMVFVSGQIPIDPATGSVVSDDVSSQTRQVLKNISAVLEAAGANLENVVKTTVFLYDMNDFAAMNAVYSEFFATNPPARAAVQVARLPKDVRVEIEAIAVI